MLTWLSLCLSRCVLLIVVYRRQYPYPYHESLVLYKHFLMKMGLFMEKDPDINLLQLLSTSRTGNYGWEGLAIIDNPKVPIGILQILLDFCKHLKEGRINEKFAILKCIQLQGIHQRNVFPQYVYLISPPHTPTPLPPKKTPTTTTSKINNIP